MLDFEKAFNRFLLLTDLRDRVKFYCKMKIKFEQKAFYCV